MNALQLHVYEIVLQNCENFTNNGRYWYVFNKFRPEFLTHTLQKSKFLISITYAVQFFRVPDFLYYSDFPVF